MKYVILILLLMVLPVHGAPVGAVVNVPVTTLCQSGYSSTVRPPVTYTNKIKSRMARAAGGKMGDYELDHLIPIGIGGDPSSLDNLWLQPWPEARRKDKVEWQLRRDVCDGKVDIKDAQYIMRTWH